jgi:hypothetical protein
VSFDDISGVLAVIVFAIVAIGLFTVIALIALAVYWQD